MKKRLMLIGLLAGTMFFGVGCVGDPGYSGVERNQRISRNQGYELGQVVDDFDNLMMLQPASRLPHWNVQ